MRRPLTPPLSKRKASSVIRLALRSGLQEFRYGGCGPVAVAVNRILFASGGDYVALFSRPIKERSTGHVAVRFSGKLFDYTGMGTLGSIFEPFLMDHHSDSPFDIRTGLRESTVIKYFCPSFVDPIEKAEGILTRAMEALGDEEMEKLLVKKYARKHATRRLDTSRMIKRVK